MEAQNQRVNPEDLLAQIAEKTEAEEHLNEIMRWNIHAAENDLYYQAAIKRGAVHYSQIAFVFDAILNAMNLRAKDLEQVQKEINDYTPENKYLNPDKAYKYAQGHSVEEFDHETVKKRRTLEELKDRVKKLTSATMILEIYFNNSNSRYSDPDNKDKDEFLEIGTDERGEKIFAGRASFGDAPEDVIISFPSDRDLSSSGAIKPSDIKQRGSLQQYAVNLLSPLGEIAVNQSGFVRVNIDVSKINEELFERILSGDSVIADLGHGKGR